MVSDKKENSTYLQGKGIWERQEFHALWQGIEILYNNNYSQIRQWVF